MRFETMHALRGLDKTTAEFFKLEARQGDARETKFLAREALSNPLNAGRTVAKLIARFRPY